MQSQLATLHVQLGAVYARLAPERRPQQIRTIAPAVRFQNVQGDGDFTFPAHLASGLFVDPALRHGYRKQSACRQVLVLAEWEFAAD
jgi:hypothetical protein